MPYLKALPCPPAPLAAAWPPVARHVVRLSFPCTLLTLSICLPALPPLPDFQQNFSQYKMALGQYGFCNLLFNLLADLIT